MIHISKINEIVNGEIYGNDDIYIKGPCSIQTGKKNHLSYIKNKDYLKYLKDTLASVIIVDNDLEIPNDINITLLKLLSYQAGVMAAKQTTSVTGQSTLKDS